MAHVNADVEVIAGDRTFTSGLLVDIVRALSAMRDGELLALVGSSDELDQDLRTWSALTGHAIVHVVADGSSTRWIIRRGPAPGQAEQPRPIGSRLWLYTNFDCNLRCDYCCVRSSPSAPRRALGLERVRRIAAEAPAIGVREFFVTGGEPFVLSDIAEIVRTLANVAPVTVLTNGMLFKGSRLAALRALPREQVTLQISLDSPTPALHDRHRGPGAWDGARRGMQLARAEGFRVRVAATVSTDEDEQAFRRFLDAEAVAEHDRVIRRIARRGFATSGVAVSRSDLLPELTITSNGVYWHPVGAEDEDMLVTPDIFPLQVAWEKARDAVARQQDYGERLARIFYCA
ncbi:MAG: radical SAM protein [Acidobacteria bacterium]|nr:radical SAM protein [Acidobacteriota bacterium]MCA1650930.1 radical SAM protein [Acidobacteriota bacterium]